MLAVGLTAALVFAVMMDAPHRKNRFIEPETSIQLAMTVAPVAVILLAIVALARVPKAADAAIAETGSVLVLLVVLWVIGYRQVAGVDDSRDFAAADLAAWMPVAAVIAALLLAIVVRCDARRRRTPTWASRPRRAPERIADHALRRSASRLASERPTPAQSQEWSSRLDALRRRGISPETIDQAADMTPHAWLAWLCYDGEVDIRDVLPRS